MNDRTGGRERWDRMIPYTLCAGLALLMVFGMFSATAAASTCKVIGQETLLVNDLRNHTVLGPHSPTIPAPCYTVPTDIRIKYGRTLTIEPGVVLKFAPGVIISVENGALIAKGEPGAKILFTAINASEPLGRDLFVSRRSQYNYRKLYFRA